MTKALRTALCFGLGLSASAAFGFELTSPDFEPGGTIPMAHVADVFGCTGANASPALNWTNPPEGTGAFALMVHDPDAPTGGAGFWHWIAVNIPGEATGLAYGLGADHMPDQITQIPNDYGAAAWGGPCPPEGDKAHRYNFTLYALPGPLDLPEGASKAVIGFIINA
ncbi:MAG: YbhB/YbcL family Raf kinase inhibitor-like protein, partial [Mangrovicoccus sp.]